MDAEHTNAPIDVDQNVAHHKQMEKQQNEYYTTIIIQ